MRNDLFLSQFACLLEMEAIAEIDFFVFFHSCQKNISINVVCIKNPNAHQIIESNLQSKKFDNK